MAALALLLLVANLTAPAIRRARFAPVYQPLTWHRASPI